MREDMETSNHGKKNISKLLKKVDSLYKKDLVKVLSNFHVNKYGNKDDLKSRVISLIEESDNKTYKQICRYIKKVYRENDKLENKELLKKRKINLEKKPIPKQKSKNVANDDNNNSVDKRSECSDESISQTDLWNISQISAQMPNSPLSSSIRSAIDLVNQTTNSNSNSQSSLPLPQTVSPQTAPQPHVSSLHTTFLSSTQQAFMPFAHSSQTYNYPNAGSQPPQHENASNFAHHSTPNTQSQQQNNSFLPRHPQPQTQTPYFNPHASNANVDQGFQPINYSNKNITNNSHPLYCNNYYNRMATNVNSTPNYASNQTYYPSFYNINNQSSQQSSSFAPYNQYSNQTNLFPAHSHNVLPNPSVVTAPTKNVLPDNASHLSDTKNSLLLLQEQNELLTQAFERREYYFKLYYKFHKITHLVKPTIIPSLSDNVITRQFNFKNVNLPMHHWYNDLLNEAILRVHSIQVQLRFGDIKEIKVNEQRDSGFENLCININGQKLYRYTETGDFNEPFDISSLCNYNAQTNNEIHFWLDKPNSEWLFPCLFEISIVKCNTPDSLLYKLKENLSQRLNPEHTKSIIQRRHQTSQDNDVKLLYNQSMKVKLICPLSFDRINTPCRTINCQHIDCFDGLSFFKMNDLKYDWYCPICHTSASYDLLRIDGYFTEILTNSDETCKEVVFSSDGKWQMASDIREEIIELDDSSMGSLSPIGSYSNWSDADDDDITILD